MVEDRGPQLLAADVALVSMAFVATCLRCYSRGYLMKAFGVEDWLMVLATLTHIMFAACSIAGIQYGTGKHFADLTAYDIYMAMRFWWLCYIAYCLTMIAVKLSIGLLLIRLTINKIHLWIIYSVMILSVVTGVVFLFVTLAQCVPVSYFWDKAQNGSCINTQVLMALVYLYGSINAICDFTFGLLPIVMIYNLHMDVKTKILLAPILGMACIASSAVLVRMAYVREFTDPDFLWATVDIAIWSDVEQGLAITAGCLATLRPLFRAVSRQLGFSTQGSSRRPPGERDYPSRIRRRHPGPLSLGTLATHVEGGNEYHQMDDLKVLEAQSRAAGTATRSTMRSEDVMDTFKDIQVDSSRSMLAL